MANLYYTGSPELAKCFTSNLGKIKKSNKNTLQSAVNFGIIPTQSQKTTAEPRNSNDKSTAHSTPQACFFMRGLHTPKERRESLELQARLSMVACNGKGSALCCVPLIAVFEPVTRYRPKPRNFRAVTLKSIINGVTQMYQYIQKKKNVPAILRSNSDWILLCVKQLSKLSQMMAMRTCQLGLRD
ncbi:ash family protein [Rodentibacter caecimuris]|uniref:ash family protein n=1 Tax=Rodentibacter caecimuris TaxID=1796644 RepID=UPI002248AF99|nr:ash family protein [Rodentibacter heylii]MCX2961897.1 ash family protein [Rodentibacter heylii]